MFILVLFFILPSQVIFSHTTFFTDIQVVLFSTLTLLLGAKKDISQYFYFKRPLRKQLETSTTAAAEGRSDALCQLKSCQLLHNCIQEELQ